jgi:opacity protein-like surface antigen
MKKIITILATLMLTSMSINFAKAGTIGVSYHAATVDGDGTEYVIDGATSNKNTGSSSKDVNIGSIFLESNTSNNGFRLGLEYIPSNAEFVNKSATQTNITDENSTTESKTQVVKGEFKNHLTLYVEKDLINKVFLKAGVSHVDIKSLESVGTGSKYPDDDIFGYTIGLGYRHSFDNGLLLKAQYEYTDYDTISLQSTNTSNKVSGDLESQGAKISLGYQF